MAWAFVAPSLSDYNEIMKTLRQSLIDYEPALLKAIAECRAVLLSATTQFEMVTQLTEALLSPVATAIVLDDLSQEEREALQFLLAQGGQVDGPRFAREYGAVRAMGPARLERESPWENPANPMEGLWYRGLIYQAFQVVERGGQEVVYIPSDLLPLLNSISPIVQQSPQFQMAQVKTPAFIISSEDHLRENFFSLLAYLQNTPIRLQADNQLSPETKKILIQALAPPLVSTFSPEAELEFLFHLGQRVGVLTVGHNRLRLDRHLTRNWLQSPPEHQLELFQKSWRADPTWNDLWHVPGLTPQPTGWENSPLRARSKILGYLEQIQDTESWWSIDEFVSTIKRIDPDFQRPNGDYESWYIQDIRGNFLMGFEHWDEVEGALIRHLLSHVLPALGIVDLGAASAASRPTSFRLTPPGQLFLAGRPLPIGDQRQTYLRADTNFRVRVPPPASLYDRFQLARFAQLERREEGRAIYLITRASVSRAIKNGITVEQITAFLNRATNNQIPLKVVEALRTWGARYDVLQLEQVTLLRFKDERVLAELRQQTNIDHLLGEILNSTTVLVPEAHLPELRRLLIELGYLEEVK